MADEKEDPLAEMFKYVPISTEERTRIVERIRERGALRACPQCGKDEWTVPSYSAAQLESKPDYLNLMGPHIGTVIMFCNNCGFLSQHSLALLGLIPKPE